MDELLDLAFMGSKVIIEKQLKAVNEAYRVLRNGAYFVNYSFNSQWLIKILYFILSKKYHDIGYIPNLCYLARANKKQLNIVKNIFKTDKVIRKYTEILFILEIHFRFTGRLSFIIGYIDRCLSNSFSLFSGLARQQSYHVRKNDK